ncbi:MAG TPA: hypothetical protein VGM35_01925 [Xanthobacteraceae bacterium]|jgi:hypothetical protein
MDRLDRRIDRLSANEELDLEIHEILQGLSHCLDRGMAVLWDKFADKDAVRSKPNIYFPCQDTQERFDKRLREIGLGDLSENFSAIYKEISSVQPYAVKNAEWLKHLKKIANLKHERPPKISKRVRPGGITIGRGSEVYIKELRVERGKIARLDGWERAAPSSPIRPISVVSFPEEVLHMLEETDQDAKSFARSCCNLVRGLLSRILKA